MINLQYFRNSVCGALVHGSRSRVVHIISSISAVVRSTNRWFGCTGHKKKGGSEESLI